MSGRKPQVKQAPRPAATTKPALPLPPRRIRLQTLEQIASAMRSLFRDARAGTLPTGDASRLCFVLGQLAGLVEVVGIERRIKTLEEKANGLENRKQNIRLVGSAHRP